MNSWAEIRRRRFLSGLFGGMAAAALANVARAQTPDLIPCQLGPSPHQKGPLVWMDMDQIELDAAYDQRFYAPMGDQIQKRVASINNAVRARLGEPLRWSYGPSEPEKLDVYRARKPDAPIFLFVHGGSWLGGSARNNAYAAEMFVNAGANFIAIDFIDIKQAGGVLRLMAAQVRSAIAWVYKNAALLRRQCKQAVHQWPLLRGASNGRRARHELRAGLRRARRYRERGHLLERHVRSQGRAHFQAQLLYPVYR
jgi:acetyl esterase/lipase